MEIVFPSSADWDETKLTCSAQGEALSDCVASARDVGSIVLLRPEQGGKKYILGPVIVDETDVVDATAQQEQQQAGLGWSVYVDLSADAAEAFEVATEVAAGSGYPQDQIAIIVDGRIISSPTVIAPISSGDFVVTGKLTEKRAHSLASRLNGSR